MRHLLLLLVLATALTFAGAAGAASSVSTFDVDEPVVTSAVEIIDPGMGYCGGWEPIISLYPFWHIVRWEWHPEWEAYC